MNDSHASLRDDYEVSIAALDTLTEALRSHAAVFGARLTGAGFGGCTVSLIRQEAISEFERHVATTYRRELGRDPVIYACTPEDGAGVIHEG
jgi:galactokinase